MSWLRYYAIAAALIYGYVTQLSLLLRSAFLRSKQCGNKAFGMRRQGHVSVSLSLSFCFIIMHLLLYTYHHPRAAHYFNWMGIVYSMGYYRWVRRTRLVVTISVPIWCSWWWYMAVEHDKQASHSHITRLLCYCTDGRKSRNTHKKRVGWPQILCIYLFCML